MPPPLKRGHVALIVVAVVVVVAVAITLLLLLQPTYTCSRPGVCTKTSSTGGAFSSKKKCRETCNSYPAEMLPSASFRDFPPGMGSGALLVNLGFIDLPASFTRDGGDIVSRVASVEMDVSLDAILTHYYSDNGAPPSAAAFMWITFIAVNNAFLSELMSRVGPGAVNPLSNYDPVNIKERGASMFIRSSPDALMLLDKIMTAPSTAPVAGYKWDAATFGKSPVGYVYDAVNLSPTAKLYPWTQDGAAPSPPPFVVVDTARPQSPMPIGPVTLRLPVDDKEYTLLMLVATPADNNAKMVFDKVTSRSIVRFK